ncbi:Uncharacterised protein [Vibrio cholerae]|nr:Uncharacterised protein [Vibrio cholerae]
MRLNGVASLPPCRGKYAYLLQISHLSVCSIRNN